MKISGFTFVRNAVKFDYPVIESIKSILPIVDEFIVSVGDCTDGTLELIQSINSPKIKIYHSVWDDSLREGGKVLAVETDKALAHISRDTDWAFYLQADEVVHEKYHQTVIDACKLYKENSEVQGLLFKYVHFYGSYDYVGDSRRWYGHEIRIIRNDRSIKSYRDAQGFRTAANQKLKVKKVNAKIYHYGWVRHPHQQLEKINNFHNFWGGDHRPEELPKDAEFDFSNDADSLELFKGTHPNVMMHRIAEKNWQADFDTSKKRFSFKDLLLYRIEKLTGKRLFDYKNYKII